MLDKPYIERYLLTKIPESSIVSLISREGIRQMESLGTLGEGITPRADSLRAVGVRVHFDGLKAVDGIDLELRKGEVLGLIGPNGAGKTTVVNAMSGFQALSAGHVWLRADDVTHWTPQRRSRAGLARSFQAARLFPRLTVMENVEVALVGAGQSRTSARSCARDALKQAELTEFTAQYAQDLPQGVLQRIGVVRALAPGPDFLLLDEPAGGLNEEEGAALASWLRGRVTELNIGLMVIDHDMAVIMRLCDRIHVLDHGTTLAIGTPDEVRQNQAVRAAYLGSDRSSPC